MENNQQAATTEPKSPEKLLEKTSPWLISVDNIFVDCTVKMPDDKFWQDNNIQPGCQYTAHDDFFANAATAVLNLKPNEYNSEQLVKTVGGCAMNSSRAANYYLNALDSKYNHRVFSTGSIGNDEPAQFILEQLSNDGITHDIYQAEESKTGLCAVTVVNVDRTCIALLDANKKYPKDHMEKMLQKAYVSDAYAFYSTAFFIASNYDALLMMAKFCAKNNKVFGFNFAAEFIYKYYKKETFEMIQYADFIFCNKFEAIACSKYFHEELSIDFSEDETNENLIQIANGITNYSVTDAPKNRPRVMIITNSGEPVVVSIGSYRDHPQQSFTQNVIDIDKSKLKDSNSAGDSFVGGFFAQLCLLMDKRKSEGNDNLTFSVSELREAVHTGNLLAGNVLQHYGCTFPSKEQFQAFIKEHPFKE